MPLTRTGPHHPETALRVSCAHTPRAPRLIWGISFIPTSISEASGPPKLCPQKLGEIFVSLLFGYEFQRRLQLFFAPKSDYRWELRFFHAPHGFTGF